MEATQHRLGRLRPTVEPSGRPRRLRRLKTFKVAIPLATALSAVVLVAPPVSAVSSTIDATTLTPAQIAAALVGPGVTVNNVTHTGDPTAAGTYSGGAASVGFDGVVLSSGNIVNTVGPNNVSSSTTTSFGGAGDGDLSGLSGFTTFDASILEFDFVPNGDTIYFRYVFGSEEYNEYVNSGFNDVFAFFVNGVNCATVPDPDNPEAFIPVTINNVNNGKNPALYRDNTGVPNPYPTELDGLTVVLTCMAPVNAGVTNTMKLAIADASDRILDSAVFLEQGSLSTVPPTGTGKVTGGGSVQLESGRVTFGTNVINDEQGLRGNLQVNDHGVGARFHGYNVTSLSVVDKTATWQGEGRLNGEDGYTFVVTVQDNRNGNSDKKGAPDVTSITIKNSANETVWELSPSNLSGGNITIHR
jgi:hypothetical protein